MSDLNTGLTSSESQRAFATRLLTRALAIVTLGAIALVHLVQLPDTFRQTPGLGALFIALVVGASAIAGALVVSDRRILWYAAILVAAATFGGYALTRSAAVPFDREDVGNWLEPIGLVALALEAALIALGLYRVRRTSTAPTRHRVELRRAQPARPVDRRISVT